MEQPPSAVSAAKIMPSLTYLPFIMGRGARLHTMPIFLPIRSSGLNHFAMPERMQRSRSPSNTVRCSSFLLSFRFSQARTSATRSSTLQKVSKSISSSWVKSTVLSSAGAAAFFSASALALLAASAAALRFSSSSFRWAISFATSMRGNSASPLCTV